MSAPSAFAASEALTSTNLECAKRESEAKTSSTMDWDLGNPAGNKIVPLITVTLTGAASGSSTH